MDYYFFHSLVVAALHSKAGGVEGFHNPFLYRITRVYVYHESRFEGNASFLAKRFNCLVVI